MCVRVDSWNNKDRIVLIWKSCQSMGEKNGKQLLHELEEIDTYVIMGGMDHD